MSLRVGWPLHRPRVHRAREDQRHPRKRDRAACLDYRNAFRIFRHRRRYSLTAANVPPDMEGLLGLTEEAQAILCLNDDAATERT